MQGSLIDHTKRHSCRTDFYQRRIITGDFVDVKKSLKKDNIILKFTKTGPQKCGPVIDYVID